MVLVGEQQVGQRPQRLQRFGPGDVVGLRPRDQPVGPLLPHRDEPDAVGALQGGLGDPQPGLDRRERERLVEADLVESQSAAEDVLQRPKVLPHAGAQPFDELLVPDQRGEGGLQVPLHDDRGERVEVDAVGNQPGPLRKDLGQAADGQVRAHRLTPSRIFCGHPCGRGRDPSDRS